MPFQISNILFCKRMEINLLFIDMPIYGNNFSWKKRSTSPDLILNLHFNHPSL